jgi:hypothetical protein
MALPTTPTEVTASWLQEQLPAEFLAGARITSVRHDDIGEGTGIFGQIARVHLDLDNGTHRSVVVKMPCLEEANLAVARALGLYEREIAMFDSVIEVSPLRGPARLASPVDEDGAFVLVIEDLSEGWRVGDQVIGATLTEAESIVDALAPFHAQWWEHPDLATMDWLPLADAPQYLAVVPEIYRAGLPVLEERWADRIAPGSLDIARAVAPIFEDLTLRTGRGPLTITHGDVRLDNVFFGADDVSTIAFIDFQLSLRARGIADLAYMIGTSVPREIASVHWRALIERWLRALGARGIDYSLDEAITHYREAALYYLSGAMSLVGTFDSGNDRGAAMVEAYTTRTLAHVVDCGAEAVL